MAATAMAVAVLIFDALSERPRGSTSRMAAFSSSPTCGGEKCFSPAAQCSCAARELQPPSAKKPAAERSLRTRTNFFSTTAASCFVPSGSSGAVLTCASARPKPGCAERAARPASPCALKEGWLSMQAWRRPTTCCMACMLANRPNSCPCTTISFDRPSRTCMFDPVDGLTKSAPLSGNGHGATWERRRLVRTLGLVWLCVVAAARRPAGGAPRLAVATARHAHRWSQPRQAPMEPADEVLCALYHAHHPLVHRLHV